MIIDELFEDPQQCPECGGISFSNLILAEKKDACYHKVKASAKVWPSAYASGRLVQCRKKGAANYGNKSEGVAEGSEEKYLWHGSRQKIPMLEPRQAVDTGGAAGSNQNAIYATSDPKVAIAIGGLTTPDSDTAMFPNDPQMVLFSGNIRKGQNVYLHKLPFNGPDGKPQFVQGAHDREFYSIPGVKGIKPTEIKAVPVDKYLNLIRKATPADLELRKKNMKQQGVAEEYELAGVDVAYELGRQAYRERKTIKDNPYSATREARKYDEWEKGLAAGRHDRDDADQFRRSVKEQGMTENADANYIWIQGDFDGDTASTGPTQGSWRDQQTTQVKLTRGRMSNVRPLSGPPPEGDKTIKQAQIPLTLDAGDQKFSTTGVDLQLTVSPNGYVSKGEFGRVVGTAVVKIMRPGGMTEDLTRRGFLQGLGAAAVAGAAGSALAGTDKPGNSGSVQDLHYAMMEKNPRYAKEHGDLGIYVARGIHGAAAENNKRWYEKTAKLLQKYGVKVNEDVTENAVQPLTIQQLATISDEALDNAYGYGRSTPGNTFGWQANLKSAAYAKQMIDQGITDIEAISDAIHKGWNTTAQAFVQDPEQFDDRKNETLKLQKKSPDKSPEEIAQEVNALIEKKRAQRAQLMKQNYAQLPDDEKEKDRVVARAMLQAIRSTQQSGMAEGYVPINTFKMPTDPAPKPKKVEPKHKYVDNQVETEKHYQAMEKYFYNVVGKFDRKVLNPEPIKGLRAAEEFRKQNGLGGGNADIEQISTIRFHVTGIDASGKRVVSEPLLSMKDVRNFYKQHGIDQFASTTSVTNTDDMAEAKKQPPEAKYDDEYDAMVARVKKLAGLGPMKTVYDPARRQYRNMPTAQQPKK